jgi:hypothetical protein
MQSKHLLRTAGAVAALAAIGFAHHLHVPLSTLFGPEVLDGVVFYTQSDKFGVPNIRPSTETFDHDHAFDLDGGDAFTVATQAGAAETIVFEAADFARLGADIDRAEASAIVAVINSKASLVEAYESNAAIVLRGVEGGSGSTIDLADGPGAPLAKLTVPAGPGAGSDDLELEISIPEDHPVDLAGHHYWLLFSGTDGSFSFQGRTIPLGVDPTLNLGVLMAAGGKLPGFVGQLDAGNDASVVAQGSWFSAFAPGMELYMAYVVMSPDWSALDFVSNRFTVEFL